MSYVYSSIAVRGLGLGLLSTWILRAMIQRVQLSLVFNDVIRIVECY